MATKEDFSVQLQDDDGLALIKEIETKRNGKLGWRTFSTWYADTDANLRERGVFLYLIDDVFWYEDFEAHPQIFGFAIKPKAGDPPYVKFESSFTADQVKQLLIVGKTAARNYALGYSKTIKKASVLAKVFSQVVTAVEFNDGSFRFFEVFGNDLEKNINKLKNK